METYVCECKDGYTGDGHYCYINECENGTHNCHLNAECIDNLTMDTFVCECKDGYIGDGFICYVNDCENASHTCDANAHCIDNITMETFVCECNDGFTGDGHYCYINECENGTHNCDVNAECIDNLTMETYACECHDGYTGDGVNCNVNECDEGWTKVGGECVRISCPGFRDWQTAQNLCQEENAWLAVVRDEDAGTSISALLNAIPDAGITWIGATDQYEEGVWTDPFGELLSYINFLVDMNTGDPDSDCATLWSNYGDAWGFSYCDSHVPCFACQKGMSYITVST